MRKLNPPKLVLISLGLMFLLSWPWPVLTLLHCPWNLLGLVPLPLGAASCIAGVRRIKKSGTTIKTFGQPSRLMTDGIYRFTRNLIYLGFASVLTGAWLFMGTLAAAVPVLLFVIVADRWYIRFEEGTLARTFGQEYEQYKSWARRWI
jgi:protein-S-isoprenylcysteine O-methyltransferase Ste14